MNKETFKSLLKYYLSCIDADEAVHLQLRKNQENKSYIFLPTGEEESLLSQDLPQLEIAINNQQERKFIERKSANTETLIDLYYGFPVFVDKKDMLSPLFFVEVEAGYLDNGALKILPQIKSFSVNRMHFIKEYGAEETQRICDELEGEFGSFEARMKAAEDYIPSLDKQLSEASWITRPILFRSNYGGARKGLRYDLGCLLKDEGALSRDTALKYFLQKEENNLSSDKQLPVLEVGMLNAQQEEAVKKGLVEPLSVVTGPPGTGKTQVVTALLASAVYNNETVLFASNNNMPVDGVYERLGQTTGAIGNWLMRLGNQTKRQACFGVISKLLERVEGRDLSVVSLDEDREEFDSLEVEITKAYTSLKKAQALQEEISNLHNKEKTIEQSLPESWVEQFFENDPVALDQALLKKLKKYSSSGFWLWLRRKFFDLEKFVNRQNEILSNLCDDDKTLSEYRRWLLSDEDWGEAIDKSQQAVEYLLQHQKWVLCVQKRRGLEEEIMQHSSAADIFNLKNEKTKISQDLFQKWWLNNIQGQNKDGIEAFKSYFKDVDDFDAGRHRRLAKSLSALKRYFPIWITTCQSASSNMPPQAALFDLVVIDEAGQCDIPSIIPLLYRAKRAVIIGDPHQFKHITSLQDRIEHDIADEIGVEDIVDEWSFTRRSAFDRAYASSNSTSFLKQHYRCHPDIIEFSNLNFYDGKLVKQVALSQLQNQLPIEEHGLIWHNTIGKAKKGKTGAWNPEEIKKTVQIFDGWAKQGLFSGSKITYGVITPFRKQVGEMRKALSKCTWFKSVEDRFTIGTAHSFQGSECDVLIYSPVVAEGMQDYLIKFAAEQSDLINVTVTRAKNLLYIVGDLHACQSASPDTPLHQLASYAERIRKQQHQPMNAAEKAMAKILEELKLNYTSQYEFGDYRLDFVMNSPSGDQYDIEVDGDIHLTAEQIQHDERRDAFVESKGLKILRFAARDVINKPDLIRDRLARI